MPNLTGEFLRQVAEERDRQKGKYDSAHDDQHAFGELAMAAMHYAAPEGAEALIASTDSGCFVAAWPFVGDSGRAQMDRQRQLVIAASLLAAEWERLARNNPGQKE